MTNDSEDLTESSHYRTWKRRRQSGLFHHNDALGVVERGAGEEGARANGVNIDNVQTVQDESGTVCFPAVPDATFI